MTDTLLQRQNTSDLVADALRAMIVDGRLGDGERINEVHLSQNLGVSRTPLREALNRLTSEGVISNTPRLGYFVKPLTLEEFEPLYAMRPILEPAALRQAGLPSPTLLKRLRELNTRIEAARDVERLLDLDDDWHGALIAACPNPILLDLIAQFMRRTRRYEIALMREQRQVEAAATDHRAVLQALAEDDLDGACEALRQNLLRGAEPLKAWLKERPSR